MIKIDQIQKIQKLDDAIASLYVNCHKMSFDEIEEGLRRLVIRSSKIANETYSFKEEIYQQIKEKTCQILMDLSKENKTELRLKK